MIHPSQNRLTTCWLLAAYLVASTLSGLFHDHACEGHRACDGHGALAACHHAADDHDCDHADHDGASDSTDVTTLSDATSDGPLHDDECAICRFVGQRVMPVAAAQLVRMGELHVELPAVAASQARAPLARTTHSRAPPLSRA